MVVTTEVEELLFEVAELDVLICTVFELDVLLELVFVEAGPVLDVDDVLVVLLKPTLMVYVPLVDEVDDCVKPLLLLP